MKKRILVCLGIFLLGIAGSAYSASGDDVLGLWYTEENESKVEIVRNNGEYLGKIVWLDEAVYPADDPDAGKAKYDRNNPDEELRIRPLLGLQIVWGFTYDNKDNKWVKGRIYDPESGKTYNCTMWLDEVGNLHVKGSLDKWGVVGRTTVWTRAEE
ncbi:MAG: DUF2147 domain-containing protein [Candidatus Marinimicrobia bacterium]|nr:DUF2147 domain-containing protein [Candidatus Neomarinimicrobiota bacterium]MDD5581732.1 DUF2147 domain-containing protein [Candidatus Neomarinimicrobiota bacterium]